MTHALHTTALRLFRQGNNTLIISQTLEMTEARASRLIHEARCHEIGVPVESVSWRRPNTSSRIDVAGAWRA